MCLLFKYQLIFAKTLPCPIMMISENIVIHAKYFHIFFEY